MPVKVITAPTEYPVTLAEAKTYMRATSDTSEDAWIQRFIAAATQLFEGETGITVSSSVLEKTLDNFPSAIELDRPPVASVSSIKYDDIDGAEQTLSALDYVLDNSSDKRGWVVPVVGSVWPDTYAGSINTVRVRYVAGWSSASAVPDNIKLWIGAHVASWFENRSSDTEQKLIRQPALDGIVKSYRLYKL
ncbi:phage conserved hypothetical protein, phiE125 gp8 family [Nitrosomonas aestuarii]|uniref:Phage gp6-like head-tail connector protein n=1 Tax=Nitrosomonas aestuarii TaxID=52441 RepID=A0A1I4C1Z7_9PROT|nr:phage head-tail connector protein [Nitrosomonas aestuarii]SFK74650.1 phage conserved hypothetical protein, phiE125 gp8 family [Nitrosomonas aestuarii]